MLESIDRAGAIGWVTIITVIALVIFLIPNAIEGWNRFLKSLGLVKKKSLHKWFYRGAGLIWCLGGILTYFLVILPHYM